MADNGVAAFRITMLAALYGVGTLALAIADPQLSELILAQPLVLSLIVGWLLHVRCSRGHRGATITAWSLLVLYLTWSVLGALSLAAGSFPAAVLLTAAAVLTPAASRSDFA